MAGAGVFVGRAGELSRLRSALGERARLVLVVGDAGIGKTRFVGEGLAQAAASGMSVISGGCLPLAEKLPLLPIADALAELTRLGGGAPFEAALAAAPDYVRSEVARLLPRLAAGEPAATEPVEAWRYDRLFAGVAELLDGVAWRSPLALLVEDVHWADTATLDFLTYVVRAGRGSTMSALVTCRSDETPLDAAVAEWLVHVRRDAGVVEIRLGPLSRSEVAEQIAGLMGTGPLPGGLVAEVYARAEGHPFFTEQLVAAAVTDSGHLAQPVGLPARLAELLVAGAVRCSADARAVLNTLALAGRPLTEGLLHEITGLDTDAVLRTVRELTAARLLAAPADGGHRLRHALLGEAVAAELLPGERVSLHERVARALHAVGHDTLAAEAAGHWAAAGRSGEELQARLTAAEAAEQVFAYADAASHWVRVIELYDAEPDKDLGDGVDLPHLYIRAMDAFDVSGDRVRAEAIAEEAYRRFADLPDRAVAAVIHERAAFFRAVHSPAEGLHLIREALRLFEGTPPSDEHAEAWLDYAYDFLYQGEGRHPAEIRTALNRGLEVAEAAGAATVISRILCLLALGSFLSGDLEDGFQLLDQARNQPGDAWAALTLAIVESNALLKVGRLEDATRVGQGGFDAARRSGLGSTAGAAISLSNAAEGLLGRGRIAEAAALIDPDTIGPVDWDHWPLLELRADVDLVRGEVEVAAQRLASVEIGGSEYALDVEQDVAEAGLWAGRPEEALEAVHRALERQADTEWVILCGWLLAMGMRACADLAERARTRRDQPAMQAALIAADDLASWVSRAGGAPFTEHPWVAIIPAARATWGAERSRAAGANDPAAWSVAADHWESLDYRHRAGYARWRQAEALLATPNGKGVGAAVLATAAGLAVEHAPLMTAIQDLARRARIDLYAAPQVQPDEPSTARPFGLTDRELDVLRLLGRGKTNPEIAAALFISPRTAGVHVTNILRKLDATTRVQAATVAERAGLLASEPARPRAT
jgi:DNA-binding CsgD family transcriptional regulator/tetratricopeptide (TPR) repeat protein